MNWRDDKVILVLCFFTMMFSGITLTVVWLRPSDGQTFQTFTGLLSGFTGALLMHLRGEKGPPPGSTILTQSVQQTKTPPEPAKQDKG